MANLTNNRIDVQISEANLMLIKTHLEAINQLIPEIGLTPQERKSMRGIKGTKRIFAEDCIKVLQLNGSEIMPQYIDTATIVTDYNLANQLNIVEQMFKNTLSRITDAQRLAGSETMNALLKVYEQYEIASNAGVSGSKATYEHLKRHFDKNTGRKASKLKKK